MTVLKKASDLEKRAWAASPTEIYPLWGWVKLKHGTECAVEDLRGSWGSPDPVWEVHAPDGYHFGSGEGTHSLLCHNQADIKDRCSYATLLRCDDDCRGWIGDRVLDYPAEIQAGDLDV